MNLYFISCSVVNGVSAYEICSAFFAPEYRLMWEHTLDVSNVVETLDQGKVMWLKKQIK